MRHLGCRRRMYIMPMFWNLSSSTLGMQGTKGPRVLLTSQLSMLILACVCHLQSSSLAIQKVNKATYRVTFDTETYFAKTGAACFYPEVAVVFRIEEPDEHYHIPLLISPFGYSTYRGS